MQVYLFRHGQTPGNAESRYLGVTDEPLSPKGIETAKSAGNDPTVTEVLVTPLRRTQMTASILFPNARQSIVSGLREMDFGDFEGRSARDMEHDPDFRYGVEVTRCMGPCPHGTPGWSFSIGCVPLSEGKWNRPWRQGGSAFTLWSTVESLCLLWTGLLFPKRPISVGVWTTARATVATFKWDRRDWC